MSPAHVLATPSASRRLPHRRTRRRSSGLGARGAHPWSGYGGGRLPPLRNDALSPPGSRSAPPRCLIRHRLHLLSDAKHRRGEAPSAVPSLAADRAVRARARSSVDADARGGRTPLMRVSSARAATVAVSLEQQRRRRPPPPRWMMPASAALAAAGRHRLLACRCTRARARIPASRDEPRCSAAGFAYSRQREGAERARAGRQARAAGGGSP